MSLKFLNAIYGEATGEVTVVNLGPDGKPNIQRWFTWPEEAEHMERYIGMRADEDVFVGTSLFSSQNRVNADSDAVARAIGVDADTCPPDAFRIPPTIRVRTGENRWHCWWVLDETVPAAEAALTAKRISKAHEAQGCDKPHTHTVSKILRVPGTTNTKHLTEDGESDWEIEVEYTDDLLTLDTLNAVYDDIAVGSAVIKQETFSAADFDASVFSPDELDRLAEYARVAWQNDLDTLATEMIEGSWHTTGYKTACNMFRNANVPWSPYTHKEVFAALNEAGKPDSPKSQKELDRILADAVKEVGSDSLAMPAWALDLLPDKPPAAVKGAALRDLESEIERAGLRDEYTSALREGESSTSRTLEMARRLLRNGVGAVEVYSLMLRATANTNKNKRSETSVWADVQHAVDQVAVSEAEPEAQTSGEFSMSFLTDQEREYLRDNPSFVDRFVEWFASRTDAPETFARSLAYLALSSVYSSVAYIPYRWRPTPLNIWLILLGGTASRKSTAKSLFLKFLRAFEDFTGEQIAIGSDATAEGIVVKLGTRSGMTSLVHTDEVQGFFRGVYTKNYAQGVLETFTDLYDGTVPQTIRATKGSGNANRASTQFLFFGAGIETEVAEILTRKNFESGFLGRAAWCIGKPTQAALEADSFVFSDKDVKRDPLFESLLDEVLKRYNDYSPESRLAIAPNEQATKRLNSWMRSVKDKFKGDPDGTIKVAIIERWGQTVAKAALLLALHEGEKEATLRHVYFALAQAELWVKDMLTMFNQVSKSEYERRQDEVLHYISTGSDKVLGEGVRLDSALRRQFARLRPQEIDEITTHLRTQGRLRKHPDDSKKWQSLA